MPWQNQHLVLMDTFYVFWNDHKATVHLAGFVRDSIFSAHISNFIDNVSWSLWSWVHKYLHTLEKSKIWSMNMDLRVWGIYFHGIAKPCERFSKWLFSFICAYKIGQFFQLICTEFHITGSFSRFTNFDFKTYVINQPTNCRRSRPNFSVLESFPSSGIPCLAIYTVPNMWIIHHYKCIYLPLHTVPVCIRMWIVR